MCWASSLGREEQVEADLRQKFFPVRVVRLWHRVPREAVAAPSLTVFRLDGSWSNLV